MAPRPILRLSALVALSALASGCLSFDTRTKTAEVAAGNNRVFRGIPMNDGFGGEARGGIEFEQDDGSMLEAYGWTYLDIQSDPQDGAMESTSDYKLVWWDVGAEWRKSFPDLDVSAGIVGRKFTGVAVSTTAEVYGTAELTSEWYRPRVTVHYDFAKADDVFVRLGTHPRYKLDRALEATLGLDVGIIGGGQSTLYYGVDSSGLADLLATAEVTYLRDENFDAFLRLGYSRVLDSALKDQLGLNQLDENNYWVSIGCGWRF